VAKKANKQSASNGAPRSAAAYFLSLSLENVRCFRERQTLDLSDGKGGPARWTILLGNNGTGKTTILQALMTFVWETRPLPLRARFGPDLIRIFRRDDKPGILACKAAFGGSIDTGGSNGAIRTGDFEIYPSSQRWVSKSLTPEDDVQICCAYGASRRLGSSGLSDPEHDDPSPTLFSDRETLRNGEEWLLRLDYAANKPSEFQERWKSHLARVRMLLLAILEDIDDLRFVTKGDVYPVSHVEFHTPYGWVPLRHLSYGCETLIAWMVDFASRMIERYPASPDPFAEPAIVLVDEIDLHLHPQWQRKLIGHLSERFPNTQFIATAHSPLIVQAAGGANIALLRRESDQVIIDNDVKTIRGWRIDQIYTSDLFGLPSARPPELDEPLARRTALLSKSRLTEKDKRELAELEARIGSLPAGETAEQAETLRLLRESLELLEKRIPAQP
jgi:hypothetical protein